MTELECRAVRELDRFRAPLSAEEWARRRPDSLTPRKRALLGEFGYPHVLDQFRLHFTLSGAVEKPQPLVEDLQAAFARSGAEPGFRVDALTLFMQQDGEPFLATRRFPLSAPAPGRQPG